jgi:XisI protein
VDNLEKYRQFIREFLTQYAEKMKTDREIENQLIFDTEHDRYLLMRTGWDRDRRIHSCVFHFNLKDGKIWLEENNTDVDLDEELEERGISKQEIVVAFHHPSMRRYSDYAVC